MFQLNIELPTESTNSQGILFQELNEDCLMEIFSVPSLTLVDLCSLAETCRLFEQITKRVFPQELRIGNRIDGIYKIESKKRASSHWKLDSVNRFHGLRDINRIFANFESKLTGITLSSRNYQYGRVSIWLLSLMSSYTFCSLENFTISNLKFSYILTEKLRPIFERLQMLELYYVHIYGGKELFADFNSLIRLRLTSVLNLNPIFESDFPRLEWLTLKFSFFSVVLLSGFISRHKRLKTLKIYSNIDDWFKANFFQILGNSCKELQKLSLVIGGLDSNILLPLQSLEQLEVLHIWEVTWNDFTLIAGMPQLRDLKLTDCILPKDSNQFDHLVQIRKLEIYKNFIDVTKHTPVDVVGIITRLQNLEELIAGNFQLDEKTYRKIVCIVKGRANMLTLRCKFDFSYNSANTSVFVRVKLVRLL